jgi:hypothetical protein
MEFCLNEKNKNELQSIDKKCTLMEILDYILIPSI